MEKERGSFEIHFFSTGANEESFVELISELVKLAADTKGYKLTSLWPRLLRTILENQLEINPNLMSYTLRICQIPSNLLMKVFLSLSTQITHDLSDAYYADVLINDLHSSSHLHKNVRHRARVAISKEKKMRRDGRKKRCSDRKCEDDARENKKTEKNASP